MKKIAILTNILAPYRLPLFNAIAKDNKVDVLICKENEKNREWIIDENNLFNLIKLKGIELNLKNSLGDHRFIYLKFSVIFYLIFKRPEFIIIGDASFTSHLTAYICKILNIKYIWWNEIIIHTPINKGFVNKLRKKSFKNAYAFLVSGTLAKEFIQSYDVDSDKILILPNAVDNDLYINYYNKFKNQKDKFRDSYNISENDFVFLYIGQFIKRKNMMLMLESFKKAKESDKNIKLFLVGGGEEYEKINNYIKLNNLENDVVVKEFLQTEELSKIYTLSDALIIVSESEPWGMVVNEAMCFGLPILSSYTIGASADLVDKNVGIIVNNYQDADILSKELLNLKNIKWDKTYIQNKVLTWNNNAAIKAVNELIQN